MVRQARGPRGLPVARRRGSPETRRAAVNILGFDARPRRRGRPGGRDRGPQRCLESYHQGQRRRPAGKVAEGAYHLVVCLPLWQGCQLVARARRRPEKPYPPQEQQYEGDAGFAPGNSPRRDFETNAFPSLGRRFAPQVADTAYFGALLRSRVDRDLFRRWSAKNLVERRTTRVLASKG